MSLFPRIRIKKKQSAKDSKLTVREIVKDELSEYINKENLQGYLDKIKRDERKRRIWDGLSNQKKLKLLRYMNNKREAQHDKK